MSVALTASTENPSTNESSGSLSVAVVGSRDYPNETLARNLVSRLLTPGMTFVSGGAKGPDTWGETQAKSLGLACTILKPDWAKGKQAGFDRNTDIVAAADVVVAFWDGESKGTKDTIDKAMKARKDLIVVKPDGTFTKIGFGTCNV